MRDVHDFGPFYSWAGRYEGERFIQRGIIRNLEPPYRRGRGIEMHLGPIAVGVGIMNIFQRKTNDEEQGLKRVGVLGNIDVDATGEEIGEWDATETEAAGGDPTEQWFADWHCVAEADREAPDQ